MGELGAHFDIPDPRRRSGYLRLSWHPSRRIVVVSHWREGRCVSSTPIGLAEIGGMVTFLVGVLQDAAVGRLTQVRTLDPRRGIVAWIRDWLRPKLAPIVRIEPHRDGSLGRSA